MKKRLVAALVAASVLPASASAAFLNNWTLDLTGAGNTSGDGVTSVTEYLDIVGTSYINLNSTFTSFLDYGTFNVVAADGGASTFDNIVTTSGLAVYELTAIFKLSGSVTLPGAIDFAPFAAGDYVELWVGNTGTGTFDYGTTAATFGANNGIKIGDFKLAQGSGTVGTTGVPNGQITLILEPTSLTAGYFKDSSGTDLSTFVNVTMGDGPLFGFVTTNASLVSNVPVTVNNEIVVGLAGDPSLPDLPLVAGTFNSDPPDRFVVGNNGQYRWSVPEPATIGLLGMGLMGMGAALRRRKVA